MSGIKSSTKRPAPPRRKRKLQGKGLEDEPNYVIKDVMFSSSMLPEADDQVLIVEQPKKENKKESAELEIVFEKLLPKNTRMMNGKVMSDNDFVVEKERKEGAYSWCTCP